MTTKEKLLELFETNRDVFFSGEDIAQKLAISRTAVWKVMEQLKEDIQLFERPVDIESLEELGRKFTDLEADIVMPSLWKRAEK